MRLKFYWYISEAYKDGILRPACTVVNPKNEFQESIANYLMDDGGQSYLDTLPWLEEGIRRIALIKVHEIDSIDWSRDAWGADLSNDRAKIYSLYDENHFEVVTLDALEKALLAWKNFIQLKPEVGKNIEIDIA